MPRFARLLAVAVLAAMTYVLPAAAEDTIKIGLIDPLSGTFAQQGDANLKQFNYLFGLINAQGGALGKKIEIVPVDDKLQPAEALIALQTLVDQNVNFVMSCTGSNIGAALIDGVAKQNARNPDHRILYLNCGALASDLTNDKCDFWHFRFDANTGQRAETLVRGLPKDLKSVYILDQDYLFGQTLHRETKENLAKRRPDVKIVGEDMIPLGKVKDFTPYIAKIQASGAEALLTGNWGPDLNLMMKAAVDAGLKLQFYTYLSHVVGGPTSAGETGDKRLHTVVEFHPNVPAEQNSAAGEEFVATWRKDHDFDLFQMNNYMMLKMLTAAITKAGSTDPMKVALALEDSSAKDMMGHTYTMRKSDHQLLEPLYVAQFVKGARYDSEKTGLGWKTDTVVESADLSQPTSCQMKRPKS